MQTNDTVRKALILAAGRGTRMGGRAEALPKCLIALGAETILEFQVRALRSAGITAIGIVGGYNADLIMKFAAELGLQFYFNAEFAATNSLYSFFCAREFCAEGALVLNSDIIFAPQLLQLLLDAPDENCLLYDPDAVLADEEMKVCLDEAGCVSRIGKSIDPGQAQGENLGIVRFGHGTAQAAFEAVRQKNGKNADQLWLPECINQLVGVRSFRAIATGGKPWLDIDSPEDLEYALKEIYPYCGAQKI